MQHRNGRRWSDIEQVGSSTPAHLVLCLQVPALIILLLQVLQVEVLLLLHLLQPLLLGLRRKPGCPCDMPRR